MFPYLKYFLIGFCALAFGGDVALAANNANAALKSVTAPKFTKGLLWKIETSNIKPSFLFGTIHTDDTRVIALPEPVAKALDNSNLFAMEALIDGDALVQMAEAMYFNDGKTLQQVIGKALYDEVLQILAKHGLPTAGVEKQKPWAVIMMLSMPPPKTGLFFDLVLENLATQQNKPITGLETISEQIAVFNELPLEEQTLLLQETLRSYKDFDQAIEELIQAYLARDLKRLGEITEKHEPGDDRLYQKIMDRLLVTRNTRMLTRMTSLLKQGNAFIAVGAAHLPGDTGLLNLLEKAGYRVTPVY
ncbi:MAG: TraB/GumN family protein [Gammaproteobacteria bacterium]|nr:TraB/GumN family protein [Gammaproteobacteria bacterium]